MVYDTINPEIIKFILQEAKPGASILDVGCGTGRLGEFLKPRLDCYLTGVELDQEAALTAKKSYNDLVVMNLEDLIDKRCEFKDPKKYDFVVFGDILEHVSDPGQILRYFSGSLKDGGSMIASIPNVANWMVRFGLLFGNFDCSGGILDQTHLRFFTYRTAKKLLEDNGYRIVAVVNNNHTPIVRFLGRIFKGLFAFQFVFKCRKAQ